MARPAPRADNKKEVHGSCGREREIHISRIATSVPVTGVQKPASRNIPAPAAINSRMTGSSRLALNSPMYP